jgi:hypothetical protein
MSRMPLDMTGVRVGRLVGIRYVESRKHVRYWEFKCDCGNIIVTQARGVKSGNSLSCGCLKSDIVSENVTTHGMSRTTEFKCWQNIHSRCYNKNHPAFRHYGGRGIEVSDRWSTFEQFLADMGRKPGKRYSIDRIDVNGHYSLENCRWATDLQQGRNRSNNRFLTLNGRRQTLSAWSIQIGVAASLIARRIDRWAWTIEQALTTPAQKRVKRKKEKENGNQKEDLKKSA